MSPASRAAFSDVSETCPRVDSAHGHAIEKISDDLDASLADLAKDVMYNVKFELKEFVTKVKVETESLREALIEAHRQRIGAEDERNVLSSRVDDLEQDLARAEKENRELQARVDYLESRDLE